MKSSVFLKEYQNFMREANRIPKQLSASGNMRPIADMRTGKLSTVDRYMFLALVFLLLIPWQQSGLLASGWMHSVTEFGGNDAGEKLQACHDSAPVTGGICDARTLTGAQTVKGLLITKPLSILLGSGTLIVSASIVIRGTAGVQVRGVGAPDLGSPGDSKQGTNLAWAGNSTDPMFRLSSVGQSTFQDFVVSSRRALPLDVAFLSENVRLKQTPGKNMFENLFVQGTDGGVTDGFRYSAGKLDAMNAEDTFIKVRVANYSHAGWSFEASQSKVHRFYSCEFHGDGYGQYGISTYGGTTGRGGSFMWYGGFGGGNASADFYLGAPDDAILISGGNFEGSSRLLDTAPGNSSTAYPVTIQGVRFSADKLNPDGHALRFTHPGPLVLIGNIIGQFPDKALDVIFEHVGSYGQAVAIGNSFGTRLQNPLVGKEWVGMGNLLGFGPVTGILEIPKPSPKE
jgi:hypothetical protein